MPKNLKRTQRGWWNVRTLPLYSRARWGLQGKGKESGTIKQVRVLSLCFCSTGVKHFVLAKKKKKKSLVQTELSDEIYLYTLFLHLKHKYFQRQQQMPDLNQMQWRMLHCQVSISVSAEHSSKRNPNIRVLWLDTEQGCRCSSASWRKWKPSISASTDYPFLFPRVNYRRHGAYRLVYWLVPFYHSSA